MDKLRLEGIKNIVFDLGGVLITLDRDESVKRFVEAGLQNADELLCSYHQKGIFLELEEGRLSMEEFYDGVRKEAGRFISDETIKHAWMGFKKELPEYKLTLLEELRQEGYRLYLLSNTNPVIMSWALTPAFSPKGKSLEDYFDKLYLSYRIGYTKPHPEIFRFMFEDSGMIPAESLFIEDGIANIETGKKWGMKTCLVENGEDFRYLFGR
jgi:putative hydrolase of the HAD superfamily